MDLERLRVAYLDDCVLRGLAAKTVGGYGAALRRLSGWLDGRVLDAAAVAVYFRWLQDGTRSVETIRCYARTLRAFFAWCERGGCCEGLREVVPMPRRPVRRPKAARTGTLRALLTTCNRARVIDVRDRVLILMLADTGARAGEICGLACADLAEDLGSGVVMGKGGREREIYFHPKTQQALGLWVQLKGEGAWLFPAATHDVRRALLPGGLRLMLKRRAARAGVQPPWSPHSWRHAFALGFLRSGGDVFSLARLLGHSDLTVTREYLRWTDEDLRERHLEHSPLNLL